MLDREAFPEVYKGSNHEGTTDSFDHIRLNLCKIKRYETNWENIYEEYDKELMFFVYNNSINKKMINALKEKWEKDANILQQNNYGCSY